MAATLAEEIEELNRRIALLCGDRKAYEETSKWTIKQNKDLITNLRAENKGLRSKFSKRVKADDDVVSAVFKAHSLHTPAELRGVPGQTAVARFDQSVCELIKRRNAIQHLKANRMQMINDLEAELKRLKSEEDLLALSGKNRDGQNLRQLENKLDKVVIKNNESTHVRKTYQSILDKLEEERLGFSNEIDALEKAIGERKNDLEELEGVCNDAQLARDMIKSELQHQEQTMASSRKERERILTEYRIKANERKEFQEKVERRLRRASVVHSVSQMDSIVKTTQEIQEAKISSYEEALAKIKDATGVSNIQEVVDRFLNQGNTKKHLELLKEENTRQQARLTEDKEKLQAQFEDMKYSGEAKMSTGQRMLESFEEHLNSTKKGREEAKEQADRACKLLSHVKGGVDHLHEKLQHIKTPRTHVLKPQGATSDEIVLEQLSTAEQKLVTLSEELASRDLDAIYKEMEDEEFRHIVEGGVAGNIRVELPKTDSKPALYDEESGSDEECLTREVMKRMTVTLVDARTKKKPQDDDEDDDTKKKRKRR